MAAVVESFEDRLAEVLPKPSGYAPSPGIREVPHLRESMYADLDVPRTLDFMRRRYVEPIARRTAIGASVLGDCAAGYGWLSFAYLLAGGKSAILVDTDERRLEAAYQIAGHLGLRDRCSFRHGSLADLPIETEEVAVMASVETLEHVGRDLKRACVNEIARVASKMVVVTTPNFLFPKVAHDTQLWFAHWMPKRLRRAYAERKGVAHMLHENHFLRPWDLWPLNTKFRCDTRVQTFDTIEEFDRMWPHYLPYGPAIGRERERPAAGLRTTHRVLARMLGTNAWIAAPNMMSIWVRREV